MKFDFQNAYAERGTFETDSLGRAYVLNQPTGVWSVMGKAGALTEKTLVMGYNYVALLVKKR